MSALGWVLFAACLVAAGFLGGTIRGAYDEVMANRVEEERDRQWDAEHLHRPVGGEGRTDG